jgi:DNA adenine methylase
MNPRALSRGIKPPAPSRAATAARPFLKWAGGKRQLLPQLRRFFPREFGAYYEPFAGSGAVFLDLASRGLLGGRQASLTDRNADIIGCYLAIRDDVESVIAGLERLEQRHTADPAGCYYDVRDAEFNAERGGLPPGAKRATAYTPSLAAMLIYLNRTGFNGLFRLNSRGGFNVPMGRYTKPRIVDADNLRRVSALLSSPGVRVAAMPFARALAAPSAGDLVYLDPPYAPVSGTANFTSYTAAGFTHDDQDALFAIVLGLARKGCHVVLSNSDAPSVRRLYESAEARAAGLVAHEIPARRSINVRGDRRGPVTELVISTLAPQSA